MKDLKILQNKEGKIVVEAKVAKRKLISDPYVQVGYGEVIEFLKSEGITQNLKLVEGQVLGNYAENIPRAGKFVLVDTSFRNDHYDLKEQEPPKQQEEKINLTSEVKTDTITAVIEEKPMTRRRRRRPRAATKKEDKLLGTETVE